MKHQRFFPAAWILAAAMLASGPAWSRNAAPTPSDALVTVNGQIIKRSEVMQRLWGLYSNNVVNQIIDETVAGQALAKFSARASKKQREGWSGEVAARLKKIKDQFPDPTAFQANLKKAGTTETNLRKDIQSQIEREAMVLQAEKITVAPAELEAFYEANKDKLGVQEAVHLRHILVGDEKQAKDLLVAIQVGADFGKLAQQLSLDAGSRDRGGDLGFISRGMLIAPIEKAAFSLKLGEVSGVIQTPLGYHILKVEEKREPKPAAFKDVENDLRQALLAQKINQAWPAFLKSLRAAAKIEPAAR